MDLTFAEATPADAAALAAMRTAVAERLTARHGEGHWSSHVSERGVLSSLHSRVLVARRGDALVGTLRLATKKPWAIDLAYFTPVRRALYLTDMAVEPTLQGQGIGRRLLDHAIQVTRAWPAEAIRLDAYEGPAGAGGFYARCGYRERGQVAYRGTPLVYFELLV
jgi:GNAT superfamily N-acetyltransferase